MRVVNLRRPVLLGALSAAVVLTFVRWTMISNQLMTPTTLQNNLTTTTGCNLDEFVLGPALDHSDPCLVAFVKEKMLVPPRSPESVKTIAFSRKEVDVACNIDKLKWVQMMVIDGAPKDTQFFFVESGANDGRFFSTTLRLETLFGWNGVLIEPLPNEFKKILENRRVWAANAALCVTPHPGYVDFYDLGAGSGLNLTFKRVKSKKMTVPCVPLFTILTALNVTTIDFLSLDLERGDLPVLKTVPFDKVQFKVLMLEYTHTPVEHPFEHVLEFLEPKGYYLVANITLPPCQDRVFVHESVYREKKSIINYLNTI